MSRIHANNFDTTLNGGITNVATSMTLTSVTGFPTIGAGVTCNLTLEDGSTIEIVKATARSGFVITIVRAQESTTGVAWTSGATVSLRATADSIDSKQDTLSAASLTAVTVATGDKVLIQDVSDSNNLKTVTAQSIADLASVGSTTLLQTGTSNGNTALLKAYDIDGSAYTTFGTLTAGNTPTFDINTATTIGSAEITHPGGTDVLVADGGSGRSSHTAYAVICGGTTSTGAQQSIASVGTSGQVLASNGPGLLPTFQTVAGTGDVVGPGSATDESIARFDGTTGKLLQNTTGCILSDAGAMVLTSSITTSGAGIFTTSAVKVHSGNTPVTSNTACGLSTMSVSGGGASSNSAFGSGSLSALTSGDNNTGCGYNTLNLMTTGSGSSGFGTSSLSVVTADNCTAAGFNSLVSVSTGAQNCGFGVGTGLTGPTDAVTLTTGSSNTLLGYRAGVDTASTIGVIAIGADAVATKSTGSTSGTNGPGIAIGSATFPVGFRGDGTIYSAVGSLSGYARVKWNGVQYKIPLYADV